MVGNANENLETQEPFSNGGLSGLDFLDIHTQFDSGCIDFRTQPLIDAFDARVQPIVDA